jgi:hypothetical protein
MIVVHFAKVSTLYTRVVVSSLAKRLEKPPFCHSYTSFGVWPRDHYMPLQRFTTGICHALLRFPDKRPRFQCWDFPHSGSLCTMWFRQFTQNVTQTNHIDWSHPHTTEHDTQPIAYLISKQAIPYRTCGGTCCPGVSTPMTHSLADSSMTNHKPWRSQPSPPLQTLLKPQHRISPRSPHITTDGRPILSTLHKSNSIS